MKLPLIVITCLLFMPLTVTTHAQETSIDLSVDKQSVEAGEPVQVIVSIMRNATGRTPTSIDIEGTETFGQVGQSVSTQVRIVNGQTSTVTVIATSYVISEGGSYEIGPARVEVENENGEPETLESNTQTVEVQAIASGFRPTNTPLPQNQLRIVTQPPQFITLPPVQEELSEEDEQNNRLLASILDIFQYGLIALLIVLGGRLLIQYQKTRGSSAADQSTDRMSSKPQEHLPSTDMPDINDKQFWATVKKRLIHKLEHKYNLKLSHATTHEVLTMLEDKQITQHEDIAFILQTCDRNRYAQEDTGKEEVRERLARLRFV